MLLGVKKGKHSHEKDSRAHKQKYKLSLNNRTLHQKWPLVISQWISTFTLVLLYKFVLQNYFLLDVVCSIFFYSIIFYFSIHISLLYCFIENNQILKWYLDEIFEFIEILLSFEVDLEDFFLCFEYNATICLCWYICHFNSKWDLLPIVHWKQPQAVFRILIVWLS